MVGQFSKPIDSMVELAEQVLNMPVRLGSPINIKGLVDVLRQPIYATGVGLVLYGFRTESVPKRANADENSTVVHRATQLIQRMWKEFV